MTYPAKALTKTIVSPDWYGGVINLFTADTAAATAGQAVLNPSFTVDIQAVLNKPEISPIFNGGAKPDANVCTLSGTNLFFTNNNTSNCQAVFGIPKYLSNPSQILTNAFVLEYNGDQYQGVIADTAGNLYVCILNYPGTPSLWSIVRFADGANATSSMALEGVPIVLAGDSLAGQANYGNLVFDAAGNLWVTDYGNNRIVVMQAAALSKPNNVTAWAAFANNASGAAGSFPVASTTVGLTAASNYLFSSPEGLDFDSFGTGANLWVANNNDGGSSTGQKNGLPSLVQITANLVGFLIKQLTMNPGTTTYATARTAGTDYNIYQVPLYNDGESQFGGLQIDKAANRLYVNDETGGWVRGYDIATLAAIPNDGSLSDSQVAPITPGSPPSGNGGIAMLQLGGFIADTGTDRGLEPDTTTTEGWESPAIVLSTQDPGVPLPGAVPTLPPPSTEQGLVDAVAGGAQAFVYVNVTNFSPVPTTGLDELHVYWAKASAGLAWPDDWDGTATAAAAAGGQIPACGLVGTYLMPQIPGGVSQVFAFSWTPPNPANFALQDSGHFCLLARIVTPNANYAETGDEDASLAAFAGMTVPETTNTNANVLANARVAQLNVHILETDGTVPPGEIFPFGQIIQLPIVILLANNTGGGGGGGGSGGGSGSGGRIRIGVTVLDPLRARVKAGGAKLLVRPTDHTRDALARSTLGTPLLDGRIEVPDLEAGIGGIHLPHGVTLPLHLHYETNSLVEGSALRISQYVEHDGVEVLVGGQTYVFRARRG